MRFASAWTCKASSQGYRASRKGWVSGQAFRTSDSELLPEGPPLALCRRRAVLAGCLSGELGHLRKILNVKLLTVGGSLPGKKNWLAAFSHRGSSKKPP